MTINELINLPFNEQIDIKRNGLIINQYDLHNNFIKQWNSIGKASKMLGINCSSISKCCYNERKTAGGYKWSFANNISNLDKE